MDENAKIREILLAYLSNEKNSQKKKISEDDRTFRKNVSQGISARDEQYTKLLTHFVNLTEERNDFKEYCKRWFLSILIGSIVALIMIMCIAFFVVLFNSNNLKVYESLLLMITAIISFVSAVIAIPTIIVKYLFNTGEDKYITDIIVETQKHDTASLDWMTDVDQDGAITPKSALSSAQTSKKDA